MSTWLHFYSKKLSKSSLGGSLDRLRRVLGRLGGILGRLRMVLESSWAVLGRLVGVLGPLVGILERLVGVLEASWAVLGAKNPREALDSPDPPCRWRARGGLLGASWGRGPEKSARVPRLGPLLEPSWGPLGPKSREGQKH